MRWTKTASGKWEYLGGGREADGGASEAGLADAGSAGGGGGQGFRSGDRGWKTSCEALRVRAEAAETARDEARKALELMEAGVLMEKGALLVRRAQGCCCGAPVREAVSAREVGRRRRRQGAG